MGSIHRYSIKCAIINTIVGSLVGKSNGVIRRYEKVPLTHISGSLNNAYAAYDGSSNIITKNTIPFNFDPLGTYLYTIYKNDQTTVISFGDGEWVLDIDSGILTFYDLENITGVSSSSPPYISFYKYEGSFGVGSQNINSADISLTSTSTNDNSINLNATNGGIYFQAADTKEIIVNNSQTDNNDNTLYVKGSTDNIGIGTTAPDSDRKLHVSGNVRIEGDLLVNGNYTQIDTNTSTTEQLRITNDGTGPSAIIKQSGDQPIAQFIDTNQNSSITPQGTISNNNTSSSTLTLSSTTDYDNIELETQLSFTVSAINYTAYVQSKTSPNQITLDQAFTVPNSTAFTYKLPYSALFIKNTGLIGIGTTNPRSELEIAGTQAIKIPAGTTAERPSGSNLVTGQIRYNTTLSAYEGYYASTWSTLGGITDTDQDTFIQAETSAGADNDELKFFTANTQRAIIDSSGNLGIGTNTPSSTLDVQGNISLNEYIYHNANTSTFLRYQTDQLTLSTHAQ